MARDTNIDNLMALLFRDPDFVIAVVNNRYPQQVARRYTQYTGQAAPKGVNALTAKLQEMRAAGQKVLVRNIIAVRWDSGGASELEQAITALRQEGAARLNDPTSPVRMKSMANVGPDDSPENMPEGTDETDNVEATNDFWNSLPGILTAAGGLVGAFTGNLPAAASGGAPPPAQPGTDWMKVILILLGIAAAITVVAVVIKVVRKK